MINDSNFSHVLKKNPESKRIKINFLVKKCFVLVVGNDFRQEFA